MRAEGCVIFPVQCPIILSNFVMNFGRVEKKKRVKKLFTQNFVILRHVPSICDMRIEGKDRYEVKKRRIS